MHTLCYQMPYHDIPIGIQSQVLNLSYFSRKVLKILFFKWANPSLFYHLFSSFQKLITIFTTNKCEKCPSSIRSRDLNSQLLEHESTPITIRPGLPPKVFQILTTSRWLLSKWLKYFLCKIFQSAWEKNESSLKLHNT